MNEFVNPQHRGVTLPAGYKDLMDVLAAKKANEPVISREGFPTVERFDTNGLAHVENYLIRFLNSQSKMVFLTFFLKRSQSAFMLVHFRDVFEAVFLFIEEDATRQKTVREIFAELGVVPVSDASVIATKQRVVKYPVVPVLPDALKVVTELLRQAYGVSERAGLGFFYHETGSRT